MPHHDVDVTSITPHLRNQRIPTFSVLDPTTVLRRRGASTEPEDQLTCGVPELGH